MGVLVCVCACVCEVISRPALPNHVCVSPNWPIASGRKNGHMEWASLTLPNHVCGEANWPIASGAWGIECGNKQKCIPILKSAQATVVAAERGSGEQRGSDCHSFCHLVAEGNSRFFLACSRAVQFSALLPTAAPCLQLRSYCKRALVRVTRAIFDICVFFDILLLTRVLAGKSLRSRSIPG